jgi:hypothetical protein
MLLLVAGGCSAAQVPLADSSSDAAGKRFEAPAGGKAGVYLYRGSDLAPLLRARVDGAEIGSLGNNTWYYVELTPGAHDFRCVSGEVIRALPLTVQAGELRFVRIEPTSGWADIRCEIAETSASDGKFAVSAGRRALPG